MNLFLAYLVMTAAPGSVTSKHVEHQTSQDYQLSRIRRDGKMYECAEKTNTVGFILLCVPETSRSEKKPRKASLKNPEIT